MRISKKTIVAAAVLAGSYLSINAQALGEGIVINPYPPTQYHTFLATVTLAYDFKMITLADPAPTVYLSINGNEYAVDSEVFFDPEIAWELGQTNSDPAWGNELLIDFSEVAMQLRYPIGEYKISIPEGLVRDEDGATNARNTVEFNKVDPIDPVSVLPADGSYPSLKEATIKFDMPITLVSGRGPITAREKNDWLGTPVYLGNYYVEGDVLTIELDGLKSGILYTVNVPEGFVVMNDEYINKEIWMEYMIWDGMDGAQLLSAPDRETSLLLKPFVITWDYEPISISSEAPDTEIVCGFPDYGLQDGWRAFIKPDSYRPVHVEKDTPGFESPSPERPANAVYLDVAPYTEGFAGYQFEVFFPAGLVVNRDNKQNPPFSYVFTVRNLWPSPEVTADAGVICLKWQGADWATYNLGDEEVTLRHMETGKDTVLGFTFGHTAPGEVSLENDLYHGLEIDINGMNLADGNYVLSVPQGYLVLEGAYGEFVINGDVTYEFGWKDGNFTLYDGIRPISGENPGDIYDIQGRKVARTSDIQGLAKGIYIVNGKKIVVR